MYVLYTCVITHCDSLLPLFMSGCLIASEIVLGGEVGGPAVIQRMKVENGKQKGGGCDGKIIINNNNGFFEEQNNNNNN